MKTSIIKRVPNCFFFQIAEDYRAICLYESGGKIKCNDCAATLLSLYENIVNSRMIARVKNAETFPASSSYIQKCLLGHYSEKTIYNANDFLISEGLIKIDRQKTDKENNLPNLITLNIDRVNYMLNEYSKIKVVQNYGTPTVILRNPYRNFTEGGTVKLRTEISIKNKEIEINKETISLSEKPKFLNSPENQKEEEEKTGGQCLNIDYDKIKALIRECVKIENDHMRKTYITNLGLKPNHEKASAVLEAEFDRYVAYRVQEITDYPYNNTQEKAEAAARKRCTFFDFNKWTLSDISKQAAEKATQERRQPVTQKEETKEDKNKRLLDLLKKNKK